MRGLLFTYDVLLLLALAAAIAGFAIAYVQKREVLLLWVAIFFLAIVSDHTYLFFCEFVGREGTGGPNVVIDVAYVLLGLVVLVGERKVAQHILDWDVLPAEWAFMVACAVCFMGDSLVGAPEWLVSAVSVAEAAYTFFIWAWSIRLLVSRRDQMERGHHRFLLALLWVTLATSIVGHAIDWSQANVVLFSSQRSLFSEILTVEYLAFAFTYLSRTFTTVEDPEIARANALDRFARVHGLTNREREIVGLIVEGKSNQEIGNELWLSQGTVKTHAHNIYRKAGVSKRGELLAAFADFERVS